MKKLVMSICMLLVAASLLGTSTFAWFSMNTKVTATGMQITAKSNNTYLLISSTNTSADAIQTEKQTTTNLAVTVSESTVYPSKPLEASEIGAEKLFGTGTPVTNITTAATPSCWYTASSDDPASSTTNVINATTLTSFTDYVIAKKLYLTVASGANKANNLSVTPTITAYKKTADTTLQSKTYYTKSDAGYEAVEAPNVANIGTYYEKDQGTITAVKVLVVTNDNAMVTLTSTSGKTDIKGNNTAITDTTVREVDVYIYYDGSDSSVNTNNIGNLGDATVDLAFEVEAVPAA